MLVRFCFDRVAGLHSASQAVFLPRPSRPNAGGARRNTRPQPDRSPNATHEILRIANIYGSQNHHLRRRETLYACRSQPTRYTRGRLSTSSRICVSDHSTSPTRPVQMRKERRSNPGGPRHGCSRRSLNFAYTIAVDHRKAPASQTRFEIHLLAQPKEALFGRPCREDRAPRKGPRKMPPGMIAPVRAACRKPVRRRTSICSPVGTHRGGRSCRPVEKIWPNGVTPF